MVDRTELLADFQDFLQGEYDMQISWDKLQEEIDLYVYDEPNLKPIKIGQIADYLENHGWVIFYEL